MARMFDRTAFEYRRSRHQHIGTSGGHQRRCGWVDPAIDFNMDGAVANHCAQAAHFFYLRMDEFLPAKAGVYRHHADQIDHIQQMLDI